jgi:hypothetical protein
MLWGIIATSFLTIIAIQVAVMPQSAAAAEAEKPVQHSLHEHPITCEAPLLPHDADLEKFVPGFYGVYLVPGHTLHQHIETVKTDLTPYIYNIFDRLYPDRVVYGCEDVDDELLAAIRSDPGVEAVWRDGKVEIE